MTPLSDLAAKLKAAIPDAHVEFSEPYAPGYVGFLDASYRDNYLDVQWNEEWNFGVSTPEGHGFGVGPDERYATVDEAANRMIELLKSGGRTQPPLEVTLRELRAEKNLLQSNLATLLGISQPAVSKQERHVSRMMIASLRAVVEAMGGNLVVQAHFPGGVVRQIAIDDEAAGQPTRGEGVKDEQLVGGK